MSTRWSAGLALLTAVAAAGCIDSESEYTLNPDGSGKVTVRLLFSGGLSLKEGDNDPDEQMKASVRAEIQNCKGVDCWKDVTYTIRNDGRIEFKGTAYFKDLEKLAFHSQGYSGTGPTLRLRRDDKAGLILGFAPVEAKPAEEKEPIPDTEEQWKKRIRKDRFEYQQVRPMYEGIFNNLNARVKVNLPGEVGEAAGFQKVAGSSVQLAVEGKAIMKALNGVILDEARLRDAIKKGFTMNPEKAQSEEIRNEFLFGVKGPVRVTLKGVPKDAFDYAKEVDETARKAHAKLFETLGIAAADPVVPAPAPAPPPAAAVPPHQTLEACLRSQFTLDLASPEPLRGTRLGENGTFDRLKSALAEAGYTYSLCHPGESLSGSRSPNGGSFTLLVEKHGDVRYVAALDWRTSGKSPVGLRLEQSPSPRKFMLILQDDRRGQTAVLQTGAEGNVQFAALKKGKASAHAWTSLEEAFRAGSVELGPLLETLRSLPLEAALTPADPEFIRAALGWAEPLDAAVRRKMEHARDRLGEDDPTARDAASKELSDLVGEDAGRLRVLGEFLRKSDNAEIKARLQAIAAPRSRLLQGLERMASSRLYGDLVYVASFWGSSDAEIAAQARRRLGQLCGRTFERRADFDAWHEANRARLVWDEAAGRWR